MGHALGKSSNTLMMNLLLGTHSISWLVADVLEDYTDSIIKAEVRMVRTYMVYTVARCQEFTSWSHLWWGREL